MSVASRPIEFASSVPTEQELARRRTKAKPLSLAPRLTEMSMQVLVASPGDRLRTFRTELAKIAPAVATCKQTAVAHIDRLRGAHLDRDEYLQATKANDALRETHTTFFDAVDRLQSTAEAAELVSAHGQDLVQQIITETLDSAERVQAAEAPPDEPPTFLRLHAPTSTRQTADWLFFQAKGPKRFETWLLEHNERERQAIVAHIEWKRAKR